MSIIRVCYIYLYIDLILLIIIIIIIKIFFALLRFFNNTISGANLITQKMYQ